MRKKTAVLIMLFLLGAVMVFHLLILTENIPFDKVWAGKLKTLEEMRIFETVSILINLLMITVLSIKYKNIQNNTNNKVIDLIIWIFVVLFALNTIGNLFSVSMAELILGTAVTLISTILCFIIVRKA
jgi:hypothetical protein